MEEMGVSKSNNEESSHNRNQGPCGSPDEKKSKDRESRHHGRDRHGRDRHSRSCECGKTKRAKLRMSQNPFIIFYLKLYFESMKDKSVLDVARIAGKKWSHMSEKDKEVYIRLAERERRKRRKKRDRRREC